tara:strand:+ start:204 stop:602 length:399 start_codon:yes stop_codon:yes gene_type:complete
MKVSEDANDLYSFSNGLWNAKGYPLNHYSEVLRDKSNWFDFDTGVDFTVSMLKAYGYTPPIAFQQRKGATHNWCRNGVWNLNPSKGPFDLVHMVSHFIWYQERRKQRIRAHHCVGHAQVELELTQKYLSHFA